MPNFALSRRDPDPILTESFAAERLSRGGIESDVNGFRLFAGALGNLAALTLVDHPQLAVGYPTEEGRTIFLGALRVRSSAVPISAPPRCAWA